MATTTYSKLMLKTSGAFPIVKVNVHKFVGEKPVKLRHFFWNPAYFAPCLYKEQNESWCDCYDFFWLPAFLRFENTTFFMHIQILFQDFFKMFWNDPIASSHQTFVCDGIKISTLLLISTSTGIVSILFGKSRFLLWMLDSVRFELGDTFIETFETMLVEMMYHHTNIFY